MTSSSDSQFGSEYNDDYETCERTYAELRVYLDELESSVVTDRLALQPTHQSGREEDVRRYTATGRIRPNGWFLSSEHVVQSKDLRRHLDWVLAQLAPVAEGLTALQSLPGVTMHVTCVWWSALGDGGPILTAREMGLLSRLNLECQFELAFYGAEDTSASE